ncbi:putative Zn-dependent peptidase [Herbinix hemicellulosilytica]|uniref:Peptidase M16 N-terminal domain-containing protein n=2 Tax=Herbinix hemicellulosilytica TaxID=1564487 RepID=A0A0H5SFI7_HERHM|nr:putative Zn-dependent peptidase [Herbinix hemicellulosilytica]CRZ33795.1 hypothetical protein HHT355_0590 [Herbinix hemicellulosilytica]
MHHIINNEKKINSIAIGGWFTKGSFFDRVGKEGEHHFLEHIIFNIPYVKEQTLKFKESGLVINAFTSQELMCFYVLCIKDNFSEAYNFIYNLLNEKFDLSKDVSFENEKLIIKREIEYHYNYVEEIKKQLLLQMFENSCPNFNIMGNIESVENITQYDLIDIYDSFFTGDKFITIVGDINKISLSNNAYYKSEINTNVFKDIDVIGKNKYLIDNYDCEYYYYGLSQFFHKVHRNEGLVYSEYIKDQLFNKLREEYGLTYRINTANMNLHSGLITFWIFKIRKQDLGISQDIIKKIFSQKINLQEMEKHRQQLRTKNMIQSDNATSEMLSLGYRNTILTGEDPDVCNFEEFIKYLESREEDPYQRVIGIRT